MIEFAKHRPGLIWLLIAVGLILFLVIGFIRFLANPDSYK